VVNILLPKVYPITDAGLSGLTHAEQVRSLVEGGSSLIQIREKLLPASEWLADAKIATEIAHEHGVRLIVNDRVDVALAVGADGVHLGQDDMPPEAARRLLGNDAIIGYSTHTLQQALDATRQPLDYIAFGPVFSTITKKDTAPTVGLEMLRQLRRELDDFPLVAIGGIHAGNLVQVLEAGADSAAMIGAIVAKPSEIAQNFQKLTALIDQYC
jgi:thiamine-phosphate pyrophosphorylase